MKQTEPVAEVTFTSGNRERLELHIMKMPYRKKYCLAIFESPNSVLKVASFNSKETAEDFIAYMQRFLGTDKQNITLKD